MSKKKIPEPDLNQSLVQILNQYHEVATKDDAKDWLLIYCDKNHSELHSIVSGIGKTNLVPSYGFLSRIIERGYQDEQVRKKLDSYVLSLKDYKSSGSDEDDRPTRKESTKYDPTFFLDKIDHLVDQFLQNGKEFDINVELNLNNVPVYAIPEIKRGVSCYDVDYSQEEYENIGTRKGQKLMSMLSILEKEVIKRKITKKRKIDPLKAVQKLNYCDKMDLVGIESIHPVHIVGAKCLVTLNHQTKTVSIYKSIDVSGLMVKGSSIINFNDKILSKKMKNPLDAIGALKACSNMTETINLFSEMVGKEVPTKSLINKYTLLIKVL